jgi:hypothetical protein
MRESEPANLAAAAMDSPTEDCGLGETFEIGGAFLVTLVFLVSEVRVSP